MLIRRRDLGERGQALILVLMLLLLVALLIGIFVRSLAAHIGFAERTVGSTAARSMAESGVEYALHQLRYGDWLERDRPFSFKSPEIGKKGRFELTVDAADASSDIELDVVGIDSYSGVKKSLSVTIANPSALTGYLLSVLNYDYDLSEIQHRAVSVFGSDGVGARAVIQELYTIPAGLRIIPLAVTDRAFGGISPGTDYVTDDVGRVLGRTDKFPLQPNRYFVNYAAGEFQFSAQDVGRRIAIIYDYLRRVPPAPGPYELVLPYTPVREGSDFIPGMRRVNQPPIAKGTYQIDYSSGSLRFFEQDAGATIGTNYCFLGTRMAGPIRVNGDMEWHNTNLLYLFGSRGQRITASGRVILSPDCKTTLWNDDGRYADLPAFDGLCVQGAAQFAPPFVDLTRFRQRARMDGLYIDNRSDIEFPELVPPESPEGKGEDEETGQTSTGGVIWTDCIATGPCPEARTGRRGLTARRG